MNTYQLFLDHFLVVFFYAFFVNSFFLRMVIKYWKRSHDAKTMDHYTAVIWYCADEYVYSQGIKWVMLLRVSSVVTAVIILLFVLNSQFIKLIGGWGQ